MKFIFWTNIYDQGIGYMEANTSFQDLSKLHETYFMATGEKCIDVAKNLYNSKIIECDNDKAIKGKVLFDTLKSRNDYDVLIRLDLDAVVLDLEGLLKRIEDNIQDHSVLGNVRRIKGKSPQKRKFRGLQYVRGPCTATTSSVIDKIDMDISMKLGFDIPYATSFKKTGAKIISCNLYETKRSYRGNLPAWHWHKKGKHKVIALKKVIDLYEKGAKDE